VSGHSKWSQIKRQKGVADAKRGQLFTKLSRELALAVREGGDNPDMNPRLRLAMQRARDNNMPMDSIERAMKRGTGGTEGASLVEASFEGYGPGGVALLLVALTDNRNRTVSEVRNVLTRGGGSMGEVGCVAWNFQSKGVIIVEAADAEELALFAIDAGAEDVKVIDGSVEIYTSPEDLERLRKAVEEKDLTVVSAELSMVPNSTMMLDQKAALTTLRLLDRLEELDDVQRVFTNADFPDEALERYRTQS
jgi:YebC/PmpR family DNA-binding regulatory protein